MPTTRCAAARMAEADFAVALACARKAGRRARLQNQPICASARTRVQSFSDAGWSSLAARRAHNPKVTGSNPVPATKYCMTQARLLQPGFCFLGYAAQRMRDKKDNATFDLPGFEPAGRTTSRRCRRVPSPSRAPARPRRAAAPKQEQMVLLDLAQTDATGLPVWKHDPDLDLTGLPVWSRRLTHASVRYSTRAQPTADAVTNHRPAADYHVPHRLRLAAAGRPLPRQPRPARLQAR